MNYQRFNRLRSLSQHIGGYILCGTSRGYIYLGLTENKRGYISCGSVLVEGTSTRFKENKGGQMATPPSFPPLTDATSYSPSTLKRIRKATCLRSLATRPVGVEKPLVHVDPTIKKADGPHRKKLRTYLGIVARDKVDVTYENWKQVEFNIPEASDLITKKKILQTFKSDLMSKWALAVDKDSVDDTVCEKYDISKEKWAQFCQSRRDPSWEDVQKKAQAIQKQNSAPHVLFHGGYEFLENKLMKEKKKKQLEEATKFGSTNTVIDPPSPIRRHVKWKMTRTNKTGQMTSKVAKEIVDKIDVLIAAIGQPEHHGRVRAVGAGVTIKQYFGPAPRTFRIKDLKLALPPEPEVGHLATRVSTKESCVDPSGNDLDAENPPRLVALGRLYEGSTTIHNIPLHHDQVKVGVEEVRDANALIPVPTEEGAVGLAKPANRPDHDVMWDATVFGVFNDNFPLYIKHEDLSKITHGGQCLSISVIQLWILHMTETKLDAEFKERCVPKSLLEWNNALKGLDDTSQSKSKATARWIVVKCNRQKGSTECRYYMMHWMPTIILGSFKNNWETYFNDARPLEPERLKAFCI
ncbi:hypothetical protein HKD37_03G007498 [Glycine soja]